MIKKILVGLVVVLAAFAAFVASRPSQFRIERSAVMAASPSAVFAQVNDFHNWQAWSPWAKLDPAAKNSYSGAPSGPGAVFSWDGNKDVGAGSMTVTESKPDERIAIRLDFEKPFKDTSMAEFTFKPQGNETLVTWSMSGESKFIEKAVCLFMDMDQMVGGQFEKGLASIKAIVEAPPVSTK